MVDFPWDKLKAETLRSICSDLGYSRLNHTKEVMVSLLEKVQESGLETSFEYEREIYETKKEEKSVHPRNKTGSPAKRAVVVSDYDTRHKRKRISDPGPRLSRGKFTHALAATKDGSKPKLPRGRPPKKRSKAAPKAKAVAPPSSTRREVFDGILLRAPRPNSYKGKEKAEEHDDEVGDEDAEGDVDMEHENDSLVPDIQVESSLASSNKENEFAPDESDHTDPSEDHQVPDESVGDDRGPAVLENMVQQQTEAQTEVMVQEQTEAQTEVMVLPADEGVVVEEWTAVAPEVVPLSPGEQMGTTMETHQSYVDGELTVENVNNVEEILRPVASGF